MLYIIHKKVLLHGYVLKTKEVELINQRHYPGKMLESKNISTVYT